MTKEGVGRRGAVVTDVYQTVFIVKADDADHYGENPSS